MKVRQKLNLITLGVSDLEQSLNFYEKGLGWKRSPKGTDDLVLFPLGGITLALYPGKELAEDVTLPWEPTAFSGITLAFNAKSKIEVDEVMQTVVDAGGTEVKKPQQVFWGGYSGYFRDPDGYIFEIAFNPFWEMDEQDNLIL